MKITAFITLISLISIACLQAADRTPASSPRAKANASRTIAGETTETLDRSFPSAPPRASLDGASRKTVKGSTVNTLNRNLVGIIAKDRNVRHPKTSEFQIAPVK